MVMRISFRGDSSSGRRETASATSLWVTSTSLAGGRTEKDGVPTEALLYCTVEGH